MSSEHTVHLPEMTPNDVIVEEDKKQPQDCSQNDLVFVGLSFLNLTAFGGMVIVHSWAGQALDTTSRQYPVPLAPSPWVEVRAWSFGSLALLCFFLWPFLSCRPSVQRQRDLASLTLPLVLACLSHAIASLLWSHQLLSLSAIMSLTVCAELVLVCVAVLHAPALLRLPFGLCLGWSCFTALHQGSAALYYDLGVAFFSSSWWTVAALLCLVAVSMMWGSLLEDPSFSIAVALASLSVGLNAQLAAVTYGAYFAAILATGHALLCILLSFSQLRALQSAKQESSVQASESEVISDNCEANEESALLRGRTNDVEEGATPSAPMIIPMAQSQAIPPEVLMMMPGNAYEYGPAQPIPAFYPAIPHPPSYTPYLH